MKASPRKKPLGTFLAKPFINAARTWFFRMSCFVSVLVLLETRTMSPPANRCKHPGGRFLLF
eukprot:10194961-Alexandrium_andersonii.AAC.1